MSLIQNMPSRRNIIRLESFGPAKTGMQQMQLEPEDFQSELPVQHIHVYYEDESLGLSVGVWDTTSMEEVFGPYPGDEFMWVLEGQVSMIDGDDNATVIKQGQTFCVRNAIPVSWKQVGFLRKFYMTYADPKAVTPKITSVDGGIVLLDAAAKMTKLDTTEPLAIKGPIPLQHDHNFFTNDARNMFVGIWDSETLDSEMRPFPWYEFVQMLDGEVTITEEDGTTHIFKAGDAFFTPKGTVCSWKVNKYVKKFYAILDPSAD